MKKPVMLIRMVLQSFVITDATTQNVKSIYHRCVDIMAVQR